MSTRPLKEIHWEVLQAPAAEREARLRELCGDDAALAARVRALVAAHDDTAGVLDTPAASPGALGALLDEAAASPQHGDLRPGESLGPYTVIRRAGSGGFGTVYLAEQREPVPRRVALKVLNAGLVSSQARARFEAERQALARMEHPAIARVFDAQMDPQAQPYIVLEYVPGAPITEYCAQHALPLRKVLDLFRLVCQAIQHAHEKGVVHRDLKPSNLLVVEVDGAPAPKVIDFGIAKATDRGLHERTLSRDGQLLGTPAYMSPEQAAGTADVDTRSDIYALGVLLYELLTGRVPFDDDGLSLTALLRAISEDDPPRPSRVLLERGGTGSISSLPDDLDWVVLRCLGKDRTRRYPSAAALADDVGRFLDDLPVEAAPPSTWYRVRKLAHRHRGLALAASAVLLALVAGVIGTSLGLLEARRANRRLTEAIDRVQQEAQRARDAEALAAAEAAHALEQEAAARAINAFLTEDILSAAAPSAERGRGRDVLLREVVDDAAASLDVVGGVVARFAGQPRVESAIRRTLGSVYAALGEVDASVRQLRAAHALALQAGGPDDVDTLRTQSLLAVQLIRDGELHEAETLLLPALAGLRAALGDDDVGVLEAVRHLGVLRTAQARLDEAYALLDSAWRGARDAHGAHARVTLTLLQQLAVVAQQSLRFDEAGRAFRENLELRRARFGPKHPDTIVALVNLASFLRGRGEHTEAGALLEEAYALQLEVLGEDHLATGATLHTLGALQLARGEAEAAADSLRRSLAVHERALGADHVQTLQVLSALARALEGHAPTDEVEALYRRAYAGSAAALGAGHQATEARRRELAGFLFQLPERRAEVLVLLRESLEALRARLGPTHTQTLAAMVNLAILAADEGAHEEARALYRDAIAGFRAQLGDDHPAVLDAESRLAGSLLDEARFDDALPLTRHSVDAGGRTLPADSFELATFRLRHGIALRGAGRVDEARTSVQTALDVLRRTRGAGDTMTAFAVATLAEWDAADAGTDVDD